MRGRQGNIFTLRHGGLFRISVLTRNKNTSIQDQVVFTFQQSGGLALTIAISLAVALLVKQARHAIRVDTWLLEVGGGGPGAFYNNSNFVNG